MVEELKPGDKVQWHAGQGTTTGTVKEKLTAPRQWDEGHIPASEGDPRYLVENDSTGNVTSHTPQALEKVEGSSSQTQSSKPDEEREEQIQRFHSVVNMTAEELEEWLQTEASQSVGQVQDGDESIGHESGRRIVEILRKKPSDYMPVDCDRMSRVYSYVRRHAAQRPSGEIEDTRWRYSLMNWGHDPLKAD